MKRIEFRLKKSYRSFERKENWSIDVAAQTSIFSIYSFQSSLNVLAAPRRYRPLTLSP